MVTRITVETRKVYVIVIGGKRRRFWTEGGAYYKLAANLLGRKYLGALKASETQDDSLRCVAEELGLTVEQAQSRAERAADLFHVFEYGHEGGSDYFDTRRWQQYVRRVARKMRALDGCKDAASVAARGGQ